jgi:hypothetical protein
MSNPEQLNDANREFEQIVPTFSGPVSQRFVDGFQVRTLVPGIRMIGATAYSSPGDASNQFGPSPATNLYLMGANGLGDPGALVFNLFNLPTPTVPNPGAEPPIGPEERLRYSCVSGKCLQDPNGQYYGIDECLADSCGVNEPGGGGKGCDCGYGLSHTVLKGEIVAASGPNTQAGTGRKYWLYTFNEVGGSARSGTMYNEYEFTVPNSGGNVGPAGAVIQRLQVPTLEIVPVYIDEAGLYWFHEQNPLQVTCP